jgi:hypothetical protein
VRVLDGDGEIYWCDGHPNSGHYKTYENALTDARAQFEWLTEAVVPYPEFSTVRVINPVSDLSPGAPAGAVVTAIPVGALGAIVHIHGEDAPLAYEVEFTDLPGSGGWRVETILHAELALT